MDTQKQNETKPTLAELVSGKSETVAAAVKEHAAKKDGKPAAAEALAIIEQPTKEEKAAQKKLLESELPPILETKEIDLSKLFESPMNPRKAWGDMEGLVQNVEHMGVLQALLVRPGKEKGTYEIIFGHRRFRAAKRAKLEKVRCDVREMNDAQVAEAQAAENLKRQDLNPLEEAVGYENMKKAGFAVPTIAERLGKSQEWVYARLKLLALIPEARKLVLEGQLDPTVGVPLARLPAAQQGEALKSDGFKRAYTTRDQIKFLQGFCPNLKSAPFSPKDAELVKGAGACTSCPFNSNNQPADLFSDFGKISGPGICTKASCFQQKVDAQFILDKAKAETKGVEVVEGKKAAELLTFGQVIPLNQKVWLDPKKRTAGQLLAALPEKERPAVKLIRDERRGPNAGVEMVVEAELIKAYTARDAAWAQPQKESDAHSKKEKKRKAELKTYREISKQVLVETFSKLRGKDLGTAYLRLLAAHEMGQHFERHVKLEEVLGISEEEIEKKIETWNGDQLVLLLLALRAIHWVPDYSPEVDENLEALAKLAKIDVKAIERAALKPAPKAKKKEA
jgi:ParB/RepB/Spo0J family partition protein